MNLEDQVKEYLGISSLAKYNIAKVEAYNGWVICTIKDWIWELIIDLDDKKVISISVDEGLVEFNVPTSCVEQFLKVNGMVIK